MELLDVDDEWENFMSGVGEDAPCYKETELAVSSISDQSCPKATDIYISTKTNISYLNQPVDLKDVFWKIPILKYSTPAVGIVKKQMKFNSTEKSELDQIQTRLQSEQCVEENILTSIDNPSGRIKFKDIRKVSIGICKKDVVSYRSKKKSAFYNCFVMILRIKENDIFKEFHVKVFNTGKLEIPGVKTDSTFNEIISMVVQVLSPYMPENLHVLKEKTQTVLINSNFNCGFYINRELLFDILRNNYGIEAIYDPCSYPGIQCKFYYKQNQEIQNGVKDGGEYVDVSFMIFRTGSVLIVGKCEEEVLYVIYEFLKDILRREFSVIGVHVIHDAIVKQKCVKTRKKTIMIEQHEGRVV